MSHELNTITFHIYRATSVPTGMNTESAMRHIFENGEMAYEACGIVDALDYINAKGFANTIVKFTPAQGHMTLEGNIFKVWATRMSRLVNA